MRYLVYLSLLLLTSCATNKRQYSIQQLCPSFEAPVWKSVPQPKVDPKLLIDKQKFAINPSHKLLWFEARDDYIGICILPGEGGRAGTPGCATAYATYRQKDNEWNLEEQKVTICPG
ncbi:MAG: hypothetical protein OQK51_24215 [Kangiellaceae bacterium]|nr:hypothetical protein [Kangiellaceae bacterium]